MESKNKELLNVLENALTLFRVGLFQGEAAAHLVPCMELFKQMIADMKKEEEHEAQKQSQS